MKKTLAFALSLLLIAGLARADGPMNPGGAGGAALTPGQLPGTATNDNASAGNVGQYIESIVASPGSGVTTAVSTNVTSISLTAGDWDVTAAPGFNGAPSTTVGPLAASISLTTATLDLTAGRGYAGFYNSATVFGNTSLITSIGPVRMSFASTTSVFLVCNATFAVSTASCFGAIHARRVR